MLGRGLSKMIDGFLLFFSGGLAPTAADRVAISGLQEEMGIRCWQNDNILVARGTKMSVDYSVIS